MLVVADSSPLNILIRTGFVHLLPSLFHRVLIPTEVREELSEARTPEAVRVFIANPPAWLEVRPVAAVTPLPLLDRGEAAAISLALSVKAEALLIDERDGRRVAAEMGLAIIGTVGVFELAASQGLVNLAEAFERLHRTDFRVDQRMIDAALRRQEQSPRPPTGS